VLADDDIRGFGPWRAAVGGYWSTAGPPSAPVRTPWETPQPGLPVALNDEQRAVLAAAAAADAGPVELAGRMVRRRDPAIFGG